MSRVRSKDTLPERRVRQALRDLGVRFRCHAESLPGRPDFVIGRLKKAIFVHGCFWHHHSACSGGRLLKSPECAGFWLRKLSANVARDRRNRRDLKRLGWKVLVIWECQTKKPAKLSPRLRRFLREPPPVPEAKPRRSEP